MPRTSALFLMSLLGGSAPAIAQASPPSWVDGTIHFIGQVTTSTCSIAPASQALIVTMGTVTTDEVRELGVGHEIISSQNDFNLELNDCEISTVTRASVGFSGEISPPGTNDSWLRIGQSLGKPATGMALVIKDHAGNTLSINQNIETLNPVTLEEGVNVLKFTALYVANGQPIASGNASAISQFTVHYQ